jgi:glycerol-3-phosphate dehydrogenase
VPDPGPITCWRFCSKTENAAHLQRSEGIHIITRQLTKEDSIVGAITPGGRHCFLIPWRGHTLIGTTDKPYRGHPDDYRVTRSSIEELIHEVNGSFNGLNLTLDDVLYSYGGLRPLVESRTKETYRSSRRYEIHDNALDGMPGLLTVEGGKWTTSRRLAEKAVDRLREKGGFSVAPSLSGRRYLKSCEIKDLNNFLNQMGEEFPDFSENTIDCLTGFTAPSVKKCWRWRERKMNWRNPLTTMANSWPRWSMGCDTKWRVH